MNKTYEAVMKCKSFYVGDPCYVMSDDLYDKYGCSCNDLSGNGDTDGGIGTTPEGLVVSVIHSTECGDGCFEGYCVDSGQIGVVNGDLCLSKEECSGWFTEFIKVPSGEARVTLEYEDGTFYIQVEDEQTGEELYNNNIYTGWDDDDEEDEEYEEDSEPEEDEYGDIVVD